MSDKNKLSAVGSNMKELKWRETEVNSYSLLVSKMISFDFVQPCNSPAIHHIYI